jgi:hypothetical protein
MEREGGKGEGIMSNKNGKLFLCRCCAREEDDVVGQNFDRVS